MRIELPSRTAAEWTSPRSGAAVGGLVVAPDIFGLRPLYDDLCQRLADEHGLVVCAPEPFAGLDLGPEVEPRFVAVAALDDEAVLRDLRQAATATGFEPNRVGLIGFCMGGMYALKAAGLGTFPKVVAFYGMIRVPDGWRAPGQGEPLSYLGRPGASPTLAIIGERDHYTPPADVEALVAAGVEVVRYADAEHGFVHDPARPTHRPDDAADAWQRCFAHLALS